MGPLAYALLMNPSDPYGPPAPQVVHDLTWNCWDRADARIDIAQGYHRLLCS